MKLTYQSQPVEVRLPPQGVFAFESHHASGFRMACQCHDFLEIFYVLEGAGVFQLDGRPHACCREDVVIVPPQQAHRIADDPAAPLTLYGIALEPSLWRHEPALLDRLPAGRLSVSKPLTARVRADLRRLLFAQTSARPGGCTLVVGLALQVLALLVQNNRGAIPCHAPAEDASSSGYVQAVMRYVAELPQRFLEAANLDRIAAELGMSRRSFTSLFRQATGVSWSAYLTQLRIDYACQLLRDTSRSIPAIAFECGYEDLSSFYRAFKRRKGHSPQAWRSHRAGC